MPRKTDSNNPADWLFIAGRDLEGLTTLGRLEQGYELCRSKLAEVLEKLFERLEDRGSDMVPLAAPLCQGLAEVYFTDRYPGFDLEDPDWPGLRGQIQQVQSLLDAVKARLPSSAN